MPFLHFLQRTYRQIGLKSIRFKMRLYCDFKPFPLKTQKLSTDIKYFIKKLIKFLKPLKKVTVRAPTIPYVRSMVTAHNLDEMQGAKEARAEAYKRYVGVKRQRRRRSRSRRLPQTKGEQLLKKQMGMENQRGQAVVEYILIIIVSITLILALATKLIKPLSNFMENYAGGYVECLLETGDLPYFMTENPDSECSLEKMEAIGRINVDSGGSSTGSGPSDKEGGGSSSSNPNGGDSTQGKNSSANENSSGGKSSNTSGSSSSRGPRLRTRSNAVTDSRSSNSFSSLEDGSSNKNTKSGSRKSRRRNNTNKSQKKSLSGGGETSYEYQEDTGRGFTGVIKAPEDPFKNPSTPSPLPAPKASKKEAENNNLRPQSFSVPLAKKKTRGPTNSDMNLGKGFSFRKIIFYLIIGGVIFALVILVGTQLNSLKKGWGKN